MEKIKTLHDASSFWFFVTAFLYVAMVLALRNGYLVDFILGIMRILDMPFAFVSLLYGISTLLLQLEYDGEGEVKNTGWFLAICIVGMLLFAIVAFMNFAMPALI